MASSSQPNAGGGAVAAPLLPPTALPLLPSLGGRVLPVETVTTIFRSLDRDSLIGACHLSRPLGAIAQAVLFEEVSLVVVERSELAMGQQLVVSSSSWACYDAIVRTGGLAPKVKSLTLALAPPDAEEDDASSSRKTAKEAFGRLAELCTGLRVLTVLDIHHPVLFKSLPILPSSLVHLRALRISAVSLRTDAFRRITVNLTSQLTDLTLVSTSKTFTPVDLSLFSSLKAFELRVEGVHWSGARAGKYINALAIPSRCPSVRHLKVILPDTIWGRASFSEETPAGPFVKPLLRHKNMQVVVEVHTRNWTLLQCLEAKIEQAVPIVV